MPVLFVEVVLVLVVGVVLEGFELDLLAVLEMVL